MKRKRRNVSVKVDEDFYRLMETARLKFKNKHKVKISSHAKLTKLWAKNPKLFTDKRWIKDIKS